MYVELNKNTLIPTFMQVLGIKYHVTLIYSLHAVQPSLYLLL